MLKVASRFTDCPNALVVLEFAAILWFWTSAGRLLYMERNLTFYIDNDVKAPVIVYDMNTGDISASLVKDSGKSH